MLRRNCASTPWVSGQSLIEMNCHKVYIHCHELHIHCHELHIHCHELHINWHELYAGRHNIARMVGGECCAETVTVTRTPYSLSRTPYQLTWTLYAGRDNIARMVGGECCAETVPALQLQHNRDFVAHSQRVLRQKLLESRYVGCTVYISRRVHEYHELNEFTNSQIVFCWLICHGYRDKDVLFQGM